MNTVIYPGVAIRRGAVVLVIPPLALGDLERLAPKMDLAAAPETSDRQRRDAMIEVIHAAASLNHPGISPADLVGLLTLNNCRVAYHAAIGASNTEDATEGEFQPAADPNSGSKLIGPESAPV